MNRSPCRRLAAIAAVAVLVPSLSGSRALAWCEFDPTPAEATYAAAYEFEVEANFADWSAFFGDTLGSSSSDPNYYQTVLREWVDAAAQEWQRSSRVPIKISFKGFTSNADESWDGRSVIMARPCVNAETSRGNAQPEPNGEACDIIFSYDWGGVACDNETFLSPAASASGAISGGLVDGHRLLRHEIGHCLGLAHPGDVPPGGGVCSDNCSGAENPDACINGPLMWNARSESPYGDDTEGIHEILRSVDAVPARRISLVQGQYALPSSWEQSAVNDLAVYATHPPRIACAEGDGATNNQCVMARAYNQSTIRINTISFSGSFNTPSLGTTINIPGFHTRRPVDIAMNPSPPSGAFVAVAIAQEQNPTDGATADLNYPRASRVIRVSSAGLLDPPFELDTTSIDDDITNRAPRVTFVRGLGATCSASTATCTCLNGSCQSPTGTLGRFVVAQVKHNRELAFWISPDEVGTAGASGYTRMTEVTPAPGAQRLTGTTGLRFRDSFDFACP